ncbi:MAG TPA: hypothetical protein VGQ46_04870 [Thermoanaerobaculia bacterium]|nr:hypothetical protein [Thermoanaerobaculia bacterium]
MVPFRAAATIALLLWCAGVRGDPPPRIGRITIDAKPVFNDSEAAQGRFYSLMNVLHVQTRTALLRRFLLFKEGDPYDPAALAETERNLRLFSFLKSASVSASAPHDGLVDVTVITEDTWTTDINGDFSNDGGIATYDFDVTQKDLFGSGSELSLHLDHAIERNTATIEFFHPAAFGRYWNLDALYSKSNDGNEEKLVVDRPQFSYKTPWTGTFLFDHLLRRARIYHDGGIVSEFRQEHREVALSRARILHAGATGTSAIVAGFDLLDDSFSRLQGRPLDLIPDRRHFRFIDAGYELTGFSFVKLSYVNRDLREEDFNLGRFVSVHAAVSPQRAGRSPVTWRLRASGGGSHAFSERSFVTGQLSASTRAPTDRNSIVSLDVRSITSFQTRYPQAFVARARLDLGWQLDRDVQFLADGQTGLRAYPDFAFTGSRRVIVNAEHRLFLGREVLQLFGPSIAVFADSGQAVDGRFRGMKSDAGIGLRIGISRINDALIRIDWAYAFNDSPLNRRGGVFSVSTSHAF